MFNCMCAGSKYLITYGLEEDDVVVINQQYIGYRGVTPKKMIQHIRDKMCINIKTLDKANFKKNGHNTLWDTTPDINIY